jgi:hypothetical protein
MHTRLALLVVTAAALCAPAVAQADDTARVRMLSCEPSQENVGGAVTYAARMQAVSGAKRMSLRFRLLERAGDGEFERVSAEGLEVWRKSRADAEVFYYEQRVEGLHDGAVYRAVVRYRWRDKDGELIHTARRRSEACVQEGGLPNLRVAGIDVDPGEVKKTAVYKVKIVNGGTAPARTVGVLLRVDGEIVDEEVIELLDPKETQTVTFNGPVCHRHMRVVVDPKDLITESREQDNALDPSCL